MSDRRRDVGEALTEIRTVRSRAQSAIDRIEFNDGKVEYRRLPASMDEDGYVPVRTERFRDPDADEMVRLLEDFITASAKFARRGR